MAMKKVRDLFAQTDQQVSLLKERIAHQREVIKRAKLRGHSTAAAETIQHTPCTRAFARSGAAGSKFLSGWKPTRAADKPDVP
jgi:hypothetical protein